MSDLTSSVPYRRARDVLPEALRHSSVLSLLRLTIAEDVGPEGSWRPGAGAPAEGDVTSQAILDPAAALEGRLVAKEDGILAGLPLAQALFGLVDPRLRVRPTASDGDPVTAGETIAQVEGPGPALLVAERPALNMVGRLSGIATLTGRFVEAVAHTEATILDTRKTFPGARRVDKYAVRQGGGRNHRLGLYDMVLIKDNHISAAGGIPQAIRRVREVHGDRYRIEVEVTTLGELEEALELSPDRILLDNMDVPMLRRATERAGQGVELEASGNVTLDTVRSIAETGVDFISVGALTHSAPVLDVSLQIH